MIWQMPGHQRFCISRSFTSIFTTESITHQHWKQALAQEAGIISRHQHRKCSIRVYSSSSLPGSGEVEVSDLGPHLASRDGEQYFIVTVENINSSPPPTHRILHHSLSSEHWAATQIKHGSTQIRSKLQICVDIVLDNPMVFPMIVSGKTCEHLSDEMTQLRQWNSVQY